MSERVRERRPVFRAACLVAGCALVLLSGCAGKGTDDLVTYAEAIKARKSTKIEPLPEIKVPEFHVYQSAEGRDPFKPFFETEPEEVASTVETSGISPPANHVREELEYFPLDTLRMVGTLEGEGSLWALVTAPDGAVHRVQPGNYLGRNYGKVTMIGDDGVELVEIIADGVGGWQEREARLGLSQ